MRVSVCCAVAVAALLLCGSAALPAGAAAGDDGPAALRAGAAAGDDGSRVAFKFEDERITESSGLAASRQHKGVYWTHNDSEDGPYVYAVDSKGRTVATVTLLGVEPRDVEAISIGPGDRVYVGDIGDNDGVVWPEVWIYRFTEPKTLEDTAVEVVRYRVRYEDGPRDAEALMVDPKSGRAYIASKEDDKAGLYEGPAKLSSSGINTFRRTGSVPWVTDGAISPDGSRLALRGYFWSNEYRWKDGRATGEKKLDMPIQRQGESVTFTADGRSLMYGSEGPGSEVWQLSLGGGNLPDNIPRKPADQSPTADGEGAGLQQNRNVTLGFIVFAVALVGALLLRRMIRR